MTTVEGAYVKTFYDKLLPFQKEDVGKLLDRRGSLIANDMGTGKTYEAIALDWLRREGEPADRQPRSTLIVAPMSTLSHWQWHFEKLTSLRVVRLDPKNRVRFLTALSNNEGDVYLAHWEALRLMPSMQNVYWFHIVADECHRMKNRKARQTKALKKLKSKYRTAMSGTPVINAPHDLWSVLNWLYPESFTSFWSFYKRYVKYEVMYPHGYHKVLGPNEEALPELHQKMAGYYVRHTKEEVLPELPEKYYTTVLVDLEPKQRKAYNEMKSDLLAWIGKHENEPLVAPVVISQLVRLQQFALAYMEYDGDGKLRMSEPSAKLDALMDIIDDLGDQQLVVFSQYKQPLVLASKRLVDAGISFTWLTGAEKAEVRTTNIADFQAGKKQVILGTISAGGVGVTLTAASTIVFLDRSWSPAINLQAEDRLHRIGQKSAVQVIDIMARDTVDKGRAQRLSLKWSWIKMMIR